MTSPLDKLVHELSKLPTIGEKTALRLALHILRQPTEYGNNLARALNETVSQMKFCEQCLNLSSNRLCHICSNTKRETQTICVVEEISDLMAIEKTHTYKGLYHVLHGALSPIDGMGPGELRIQELVNRLKTETTIQEIILATNPNVTGDATAHYLLRILKPFNQKITKLASGIPIGGHIEFIDQNTLSRALEQRMEFL